ncbi:helix-turn-helix domain-containing protein [Klebsiella variicola]|uniref:helix-turn-helix domain-containing protein n=1 Tax=Klebsiella variicola TaxID=244366 RepID=UPI00109D3D87|nr:helix-turn-helix transcriptional regulator [Klebsiella variicola]
MNDEGLPEEVSAIMRADGVRLIAAWRIYRGLTPEEVAERLGVTPRRFIKWEKCFSPCHSTLFKLAHIYACSVAELIED